MNGYIEAGYSVALGTLIVYSGALGIRRFKLSRSLRPLRAESRRPSQDEDGAEKQPKWR